MARYEAFKDCAVARVLPPERAAVDVVRVAADSGTAMRKVGLPETNAFTTVDLVQRSEAQSELPKDRRVGALVELVVTSAGGAPLPEVTLDVSEPDGLKRSVRTSANGRALVPDVRPGRNTAPIILSENAAPQLDTDAC